MIEIKDSNDLQDCCSVGESQKTSKIRPLSQEINRSSDYFTLSGPTFLDHINSSKRYATSLQILNDSTQKFMDYPSSSFADEVDDCDDDLDQGVEHELNGSELLHSLKGIPGLSRPKDKSEEIYFKKSKIEPSVQMSFCDANNSYGITAHTSHSQSHPHSRPRHSNSNYFNWFCSFCYFCYSLLEGYDQSQLESFLTMLLTKTARSTKNIKHLF